MQLNHQQPEVEEELKRFKSVKVQINENKMMQHEIISKWDYHAYSSNNDVTLAC